MGVLTKARYLFHKYPLIRGSLSYAIIWPACSLTQEYFEHGKTLAKADWPRAARFCIFGALYLSPTYYWFLKYTLPYFKGKDMRTAIYRSLVEHIVFTPFGLASFFFLLPFMEGYSTKACVNEVRQKFLSTYIAGSIYWPAVQIANFYFISEKNRLVFVSIFEFIWVLFLAYKKD